MTKDWRAFPDAIDTLKGLLEWPDGTKFSDEEIDRIVLSLRANPSCVDCRRFLNPEEAELNGNLCNDCDHYRRTMAAEPPQ